MPDTYQMLPPLSEDDLARLKASIIAHGVEVPVIVDGDGQIIDGHHRAMIADSLGIDYPREVREGLTDTDKRALAIRLNVARRHFTDAQKVLFGIEIEPAIRDEVKRLRGQRVWEVRRSLSAKPDNDRKAARRRQESTAAKVAQAVGLGGTDRYVRNKADLLAAFSADPEVEQRVRSGAWDMADVRRAMGKNTHRSPKARHEKEQAAAAPPAKPVAMANVSPHIRDVMRRVHDVMQRVRLLRTQHEIGRLVVGVEGEVLAREVDEFWTELGTFAAELRHARKDDSGGYGIHDRANARA